YMNTSKPRTNLSWYNHTFRYKRQTTNITYDNQLLPYAKYNNDIRKVITLGSMWRGVPLINYANEAVFGDGFGQAPFKSVLTLIDVILDFTLIADFLQPGYEVMAIESNWLRQLIYQTSKEPMPDRPRRASPFDDNVAY